MTQNETRFVLEAIADEWPQAQIPDNLRRIDEDEPVVLETGERVRSIDLAGIVAVRARLDTVTRTPTSTQFRYEVETDVSVRVEAVHERQHGAVASAGEFDRYARNVVAALNSVRAYPTVAADAAHPQPITYHTLTIPDESPALSEANQSDYYRRDITVRLTGKEPTPQET